MVNNLLSFISLFCRLQKLIICSARSRSKGSWAVRFLIFLSFGFPALYQPGYSASPYLLYFCALCVKILNFLLFSAAIFLLSPFFSSSHWAFRIFWIAVGNFFISNLFIRFLHVLSRSSSHKCTELTTGYFIHYVVHIMARPQFLWALYHFQLFAQFSHLP